MTPKVAAWLDWQSSVAKIVDFDGPESKACYDEACKKANELVALAKEGNSLEGCVLPGDYAKILRYAWLYENHYSFEDLKDYAEMYD